MTPSEFVSALKTQCRDAAVEDCVANFTSPPGRKPAQSLIELSRWFNALTAQDREMVVRAMSEVANTTLFGVLAVLDGARAIEGLGEKSVFHLTAKKGGVESIIYPSSYALHDL